eukprot:c46039_g1_i1.p1 GENE.c46039_g1_i1~~c46039_g1_i1.p1  ORF type:complete len:442 (+),score=72.61 c46039_g1_i1:90-1415(+)
MCQPQLITLTTVSRMGTSRRKENRPITRTAKPKAVLGKRPKPIVEDIALDDEATAELLASRGLRGHTPEDAFIMLCQEQRPRSEIPRLPVLLSTNLLAALFMQNFNIYQTNFQNCNFVCFWLCAVLVTRHLWTVRWSQTSRSVGHTIVLGLVLTLAACCAFVLYLHNSFYHFTFLVYPLWMCIALFHFNVEGADGTGAWVFLHLRHIVIGWIEGPYNAAFVPLMFIENRQLYYDLRNCYILLAVTYANIFVLVVLQTLSAHGHIFCLQAMRIKSYYRMLSLHEDDHGLSGNNGAVEDEPPPSQPSGQSVPSSVPRAKMKPKPLAPIGMPPRPLQKLFLALFSNPRATYDAVLVLGLVNLTFLVWLVAMDSRWALFFVMLTQSWLVLFLGINDRALLYPKPDQRLSSQSDSLGQTSPQTATTHAPSSSQIPRDSYHQHPPPE